MEGFWYFQRWPQLSAKVVKEQSTCLQNAYMDRCGVGHQAAVASRSNHVHNALGSVLNDLLFLSRAGFGPQTIFCYRLLWQLPQAKFELGSQVGRGRSHQGTGLWLHWPSWRSVKKQQLEKIISTNNIFESYDVFDRPISA